MTEATVPIFLRDLRERDEPVRVLTVDVSTETVRERTGTLPTDVVVEAASPSTARERFDADAHHAVVTIDDPAALAFLSWLREDRGVGVPVVVVGDTDDAATVREAANRGADRFLSPGEAWNDDGLAETVLDEAETYRAQSRRLEREREYRAILQDLQEGYYRTDANGTLTRATPAAVDLVEYDSLEQVLGMDIMEFYPDDAERGIIDALRENGGSVDNFELQLRRQDGSLVDVVTSSHFVTDDDGTPVGVEGILRDITERKDAERALRNREKRLSAIYQSSPTAITLSSLEAGEFIEVNEAFTDITGYETDEVVGETATDIGIWADPDDREAFVQTVLEEGGAYDHEYRFVAKDDETIYGLISAELVTIDGERYMLATTLDITERKRRERELQQKNDRLDEFASIVSHDLRNPLNVAAGRAALLADETDSEHVEPLRDALDRMGRIVEDTLTLARQGRTVSDTEWTSLATLAHDSWRHVDTAEASLSVETDVQVRCDPDRIRHLFENCFRNAVAHAGDDVAVRVGSLDDGFYVEDDGPGIPEDSRQEVFEPGTTTHEDGTGFGLSIVARVVEAHGWEIAVTDGTDGGARFEVSGADVRMA